MPSLTILLVAVGTLLILVGYLLLMADENGNIDLNYYRFAGCWGMVLTRFGAGVRDLWARQWSVESRSAAMVLGGALVAALAVWST